MISNKIFSIIACFFSIFMNFLRTSNILSHILRLYGWNVRKTENYSFKTLSPGGKDALAIDYPIFFTDEFFNFKENGMEEKMDEFYALTANMFNSCTLVARHQYYKKSCKRKTDILPLLNTFLVFEKVVEL